MQKLPDISKEPELAITPQRTTAHITKIYKRAHIVWSRTTKPVSEDKFHIS
jgi:hypothetical protein